MYTDENARAYIACIFGALTSYHRNSQYVKESNELKLKDECDVFYIMEILAADVAGCAQRILKSGKIEDAEVLTVRLQKGSVIADRRLLDWCATDGDKYPTFANYIYLNDHLRILAIRYLQELAGRRNGGDCKGAGIAEK